MTASARATRLASLALLTAILAASCALARAQAPPVAGGTVPSVLSLSLGEPSPFRRVGSGLFVSTIRAEVTASDAPVTLSLADAETGAPPLRRWSQPVSLAAVKIRLRRGAPDARALKSHHELLWVTLTAAGP